MKRKLEVYSNEWINGFTFYLEDDDTLGKFFGMLTEFTNKTAETIRIYQFDTDKALELTANDTRTVEQVAWNVDNDRERIWVSLDPEVVTGNEEGEETFVKLDVLAHQTFLYEEEERTVTYEKATPVKDVVSASGWDMNRECFVIHGTTGEVIDANTEKSLAECGFCDGDALHIFARHMYEGWMIYYWDKRWRMNLLFNKWWNLKGDVTVGELSRLLKAVETAKDIREMKLSQSFGNEVTCSVDENDERTLTSLGLRTKCRTEVRDAQDDGMYVDPGRLILLFRDEDEGETYWSSEITPYYDTMTVNEMAEKVCSLNAYTEERPFELVNERTKEVFAMDDLRQLKECDIKHGDCFDWRYIEGANEC